MENTAPLFTFVTASTSCWLAPLNSLSDNSKKYCPAGRVPAGLIAAVDDELMHMEKVKSGFSFIARDSTRDPFIRGDRVVHALFGYGTVTAYQRRTELNSVRVKFENAGYKWIVADEKYLRKGTNGGDESGI